jgi:hypothetical protein
MIPKKTRVARARMMATDKVKRMAKRAPFFPISFQRAAIVAKQGM